MKTWIESARVYVDRRVLVILFLGFSSGLPLLLVYSSLSAWLQEENVSRTAIGLFSWASTAYAIKFLWSPMVDHMPLPPFTTLLGQRRGWLVFSQLLLIVTMLGLGSTDPSSELWRVALWATLLAFASATQDIVVDAYRVETLEEHEQGAGAANYVLGYRVAMLAAGAGTLFIAEAASWFWAYAVMAALMGVGILTVLVSPEPRRRPKKEPATTAFLPRFAARLNEAVIRPFADFVLRPHWLAILLFVALFKYGEALLGVMANPFYLDIGFTKGEIATVSKLYGFFMTVGGGFIGGVMVARMGILRALLWSGLLQCLANLIFAVQAMVGHSLPMLAVSISIENLTAGMATAAFVAYLSSLCNVAYTATQYALFSSIANFARIIFASGGGWLADQIDWVSYFVITTFAAVPALLVLVWLMRRLPATGPPPGPGEPAPPG